MPLERPLLIVISVNLATTLKAGAGNITVLNLSPTELPYTPGDGGGGGGGSGAPGAFALTYLTMTSPDVTGSPLAWASVATPVRVNTGRSSPAKREILLPPYSVTMLTLG